VVDAHLAGPVLTCDRGEVLDRLGEGCMGVNLPGATSARPAAVSFLDDAKAKPARGHVATLLAVPTLRQAPKVPNVRTLRRFSGARIWLFGLTECFDLLDLVW
jgi:hypothetical protein